jgi:hypothetical protein
MLGHGPGGRSRTHQQTRTATTNLVFMPERGLSRALLCLSDTEARRSGAFQGEAS